MNIPNDSCCVLRFVMLEPQHKLAECSPPFILWQIIGSVTKRSKASILLYSTFFMLQLSHPYMTIGKAIALTIQKFGSKVMSLLFNMRFSFVIDFLPRSKHLLISWPQSPSAVIMEIKKIKFVTVSIGPCLFTIE